MKINRDWKSQTVAVLVPLLLLMLIFLGWPLLRVSLGRLFSDFFYPYLMVSRKSADFLSDTTLLALSRHELAGQIELLRRENRRLALQAAGAAELLVENDRLRHLLKLSPAPGWHYLNAEVILRDPYSWNDRLKINCGSRDGAAPGDAVITADAEGVLSLVGVIEQTQSHVSDVITIYNPALRLSAALPLSGTIGVLNESRRQAPAGRIGIGFLPVGGSYTVGEMLQTSGFENRVPGGIKIGNLSSVQAAGSLLSNEQYLSGTITPAVSFNDLRYVIVAGRSGKPAEMERP